jgi:hypothetical protein
MATLTHDTLHAEDVLPVRSRISWGAIVAGSVLALSLYLLFTLLGGAIGMSVSDKFEGRSIGNGAAVWAVLTTAVSLLIGGFVASQLTVGENKLEGAMYGLLVWAVVFAMLLWLMASGVRAGFGAMVGVSTATGAAARNVTQADVEDVARRAGYSQQQIDDLRNRVRNAPADAKAVAEDPATKARAEQMATEAAETTTRVTWYTFLGTLVSMLTASLGGYVGSGPTLRLFAVPVSRIGQGGSLPAMT